MSEIPEDIMGIANFVVLGHRIGMDFGAERKERLVEDIARALLSEREFNQWQPIETAPKDGTWIFAYREAPKFGVSDRHAIIRWLDEVGDFVWPDQPFDIYECDLEAQDDRGFYAAGVFESQGTFTHWMPLPAPPITNPAASNPPKTS